MTMRVYVGTYAKYNSGSIEGKRLDLRTTPTRAHSADACREPQGRGLLPSSCFRIARVSLRASLVRVISTPAVGVV